MIPTISTLYRLFLWWTASSTKRQMKNIWSAIFGLVAWTRPKAFTPTGRVYYDVGGFYERHFEEKSWTETASDIYKESRVQYTESRWSGWPQPSIQGQFIEWFMKFQITILGRVGHKYYTSANKVLRASEADRRLDIPLPHRRCLTGQRARLAQCTCHRRIHTES